MQAGALHPRGHRLPNPPLFQWGKCGNFPLLCKYEDSMPDLQQRLDDLRRTVQALPEDADPTAVAELERQARALLADAKNTPNEAGAQALFGELARLSSPTSPVAATVRGLLRRARIRIEIAGDDDDIDEAIDILAEALALSPRDQDVITMLEDAARHNGQ